MDRPPPRVYADTSVYGGVFDEEFAEASRRFFDAVRQGEFVLVASVAVQQELAQAPDEVRERAEELFALGQMVEITEEAIELQQAYLGAEVVTSRGDLDALHVALATVAGCAIVVSWNFRHIVHFEKIPKYVAVNTLRGYAEVAIHSPPEVVEHEDT